MAQVRTVSDVRNEFLGRRELVCDFEDAAGRLRRPEAVEAVRAEHGLEGGLVVPVRLQNHVGRTHVTGTFFVYEDEAAAKAHIDPSIMARIEKSLATKEEPAAEEAEAGEAKGASDGGAEAGEAKGASDGGAEAGEAKGGE
ncbi:MAG: hypothetical protein EB824_01525 [Thaumarchaeota archaeon S15]|nr:hypothetical protein [Nitrososphaerota archaeon]MDD9843270.1 hypothetical protein [Nitrososphaerota archaeon]RNJ75508.1 MAG: hypothetical protein EB824_01525 [Thaumarchaeota archaeon S15]